MARRLNAAGNKPRLAKEWSISAIKDILSNPVYIGKIKWDSRKTVREYKNGKIIKRRPRSKEYILCDGLHEPIIDSVTWQIVQEKRSKHEAPVPHNDTIFNPLTGIVFCAKCGKRMQRRPYKARGWDDTLICTNIHCDNISSKLFIVEDKIIESLKEWLKDYKTDCTDYIEEMNSRKKVNLEENIKSLNKELEVQNKKLTNVYDFFEDGTYTKEMFSQRCQLIFKNISEIKASIEEIEQQIEIENKKEEGKKSIVPKIQNVLDIYYNLETVEEKNILLKSVVKRVDYLKTKKALKKNADLTDFELDIYPYVG